MNQVKWGVMGTAYIFARDTARGMSLADNCELTAIAGRTLEKAEAFKEKYGFQRAYGSYMEFSLSHCICSRVSAIRVSVILLYTE